MPYYTTPPYFLNCIDAEIENFSTKEKPSLLDTQSISTYVYIQLHKSILSGEYYSIDGLDAIKKIYEKLFIYQEKQAQRLQLLEALGQKGSSKSLTPILNFIKDYKETAEIVIENLSHFRDDEAGVIIDVSQFHDYKFQHLNSADDKDLVRASLYKINLLLVIIDEYLECSDDTIKELKALKKYIRKIGGSKLLPEEILVALYDKAEFLQYKIEFRNYKDKTNLTEIPQLNSTNIYSNFKDRSIQHYNQEIDYAEIEKLEKVINRFNAGATSAVGEVTLMSTFHKLNKAYKRKGYIDNSETRIKKLENLNEAITTMLNSSTYDFDKFSLQSLCNLISNSICELKWQNEESKRFSKIVADFRDYIDKKTSSPESQFIKENFKILIEKPGISDYYSLKIFINYIENLVIFIREDTVKNLDLKTEISTDEVLNDVKLRLNRIFDFILEIYQNCHQNIKLRFRKMQSYEFKPVYLTYDECLCDHQWSDYAGKIFLDSSYILPNDFNRVKIEIKHEETYLKSKLQAVINKIEMDLTVRLIDKKNEDFVKKVKENEFKVVQIVALFVSIATFVLATIKIFEGKNGLQSFGLIIGMAACFILFNSVLNWLIQWQIYKDNWKLQPVVSGIVYLGIFIALCGISYNILLNEGTKLKEIEIVNLKNDSSRKEIKILQDTLKYFKHK